MLPQVPGRTCEDCGRASVQLVDTPNCLVRRVTATGIGLFILLAFFLLNLQPSRLSCPLFGDVWTEEYCHGWPFTYMVRDGEFAGTGMTPPPYLPWPIFDNPPCRLFRPLWLAVDSIIAMVITAVSAPAIGSWIGRQPRWIRSVILSLIVVTVLAWIALGLFGAFRWPNGYPGLASRRHVEYPVSFLAVATLLFVGSAFVAPHLIVALSIWWSAVILFKRAIVPRWVSEPQLPFLLAKTVVFACFLAYVVNDALKIASPLAFLTISGVATVAALSAMIVSRYIGPSCDTVVPVANRIERRVLGLASSTWLASLLVGWATISFAFFDRTGNVWADHGSFAARGWPWVYLAVVSNTSEDYGRVTESGFTIGSTNWQPACANAFIAILVIVGTVFTMHRFTQASFRRWQFSVRTFFWITFVIGVLLWLPEPNGRYIWWPNWFTRSVIYFGTGCGAYAVASAVGWIATRFVRMIWTM